MEERVWYFVWRLLSLKGVRVREIFIADRVGGEGLRSGRPVMGRDIDYLVVVDGELDEAKAAAKEVEKVLNRIIAESVSS